MCVCVCVYVCVCVCVWKLCRHMVGVVCGEHPIIWFVLVQFLQILLTPSSPDNTHLIGSHTHTNTNYFLLPHKPLLRWKNFIQKFSNLCIWIFSWLCDKLCARPYILTVPWYSIVQLDSYPARLLPITPGHKIPVWGSCNQDKLLGWTYSATISIISVLSWENNYGNINKNSASVCKEMEKC